MLKKRKLFSWKIFLLTVFYGVTLELSVGVVYASFSSFSEVSRSNGNTISTGFWITPSPTITPTPTVTLTPTPTGSPTPTPTGTQTPTPTITETPTPTPTETLTPTPSDTPTPTPTETLTPTPSIPITELSPTPTPTPTETSTPTPTGPPTTPTETQTPTPTPTPTGIETPTPTPTGTEEPLQTVVINELMWMGSSASSSDEWLELRNMTGGIIDISGWKLLGAAVGDATIITIPALSSIPANGFFLISNFNEATTSSVLNVAPDFVTTTLQLDNTDAQVILRNAADALIDVADDDLGTPAAGSDTIPNASMERKPTPGDGTVAGNWGTATSASNFDGGVTDLGTPKFTNSTL